MSEDVMVAQNTSVAFPANLAKLFAGKNNIAQQESINQISFKGKIWSVHANGSVKQLLDEDGNGLPMIEVVILNANPRRSRTFFAGKFDGEGKHPDCHSFLGKVPANDVEVPQAQNCEVCAQSVKGSRMNDRGEPVTACSLRQRAVCVPSDRLDFPALLINMASTSAYNKDSADEAKGWFGFDQYKTELGKRGVPHTAAVRTKIRFAPNDAFPRLQFRFSGLLEEDDIAKILPRIDSDEVQVLLNADYNKPPVEHKTIAAPTAPTAPAAQPEVPVAAFGAVSDPEPQPAAKAAPKPAVAPVADKPEPAAQPAKPAAVKPVVVDTETDLNSILSAWD